MALRRQNLSPTSNLLRNSRLFSLPTPLPRPNVSEVSGIGTQKVNHSATLPYPTHQAIATTPKSLARGDWGLKRPLPARSYLVQTSSPVLRVTQLDTIEHITDFDSAADHVRTRQKFEELGIPMMKGMGSMSDHDITNAALKSAFEKRADVTAYDKDDGLDEAGMFLKVIKENAKKNAQSAKTGTYTPFTPPQMEAAHRANNRWKHGGPWLPGMSAGDFTVFLTKELTARRKEFNKLLVEFAKNQIYTSRQAASSRSSQPLPMDPEEAEKVFAQRQKAWSKITDEEVAATIRELRRETAIDPLTSKLVSKLIVPFLHLPPIKLKPASYSADPQNQTATGSSHTFTPDTTPSSTHPSAGLGYLRANATLSNHPILGPQAAPAPRVARVVQPRKTGSSTELHARLGVAGFVANDEHRGMAMASNQGQFQHNDVISIDYETPGGKKLYVQPEFGSVTPTGRVHLKLRRDFGESLQVMRGLFDDQAPAREHIQDESDVLSDLGGTKGSSEGVVLDSKSKSAQDVVNFLAQMSKPKGDAEAQDAQRDSEVLDAPSGEPTGRR